MAEILGIVAGGAGLLSIALQLLESGDRIKRLYESYRDAPVLVKEMLDDLETFALLLNKLEKDRQQYAFTDHLLVERRLRSCIREAERVAVAVGKLELDLRNSKIRGRLFTALNRTAIAQLCDQLSKAEMSLMFAVQLSEASYQRAEHIRTREHLDRSTNLLQQMTLQVAGSTGRAKGESTSAVVQRLSRAEHHRDQAALQVVQQTYGATPAAAGSQRSPRSWRIRFSPWFTARVWEVSLRIAHTGFDINLRTCHFVPSDSAIFTACEGGDIAEVQALFRKGEASPFDCSTDHYGAITVLSAAAASANYQLCRFLIETAGFPVKPHEAQDPLNVYVTSGLAYTEESTMEASDMYRMLLEQPEWNAHALVTDEAGCPWWWACPDASCARLVEDQCSDVFENLSWPARFGVAIENSGHRYKTLPGMFLVMLGLNGVDANVARTQDTQGRTALHLLASRCRDDGIPHTWVDFTQALLAYGADIHHVSKEGFTPLKYLFRESVASDPTLFLQQWVGLLRAAGVDLMDYGRREWELWSSSNHAFIENYDTKITAWTYGADVGDWTADFLWKVKVPVYKLISAPGTWLDYQEFRINTICWDPEEEDQSLGPWEWSQVQGVTLYTKRDQRIDESERSLDLNTTQDDCRTVMRLVETNPRLYLRSRSHSQPARSRDHRGVFSDRYWLPRCHRCLDDGRLTLGFDLGCLHGHSRCTSGISTSYWGDRSNYVSIIKQQLRRFQARYRDESELRALPYDAYRYTWARSSSCVPAPRWKWRCTK